MKKENKLIAEFMGMEESNGEYYRRIYNSGDWIPVNDLEFETSWDWLMPVVEKCYDNGAEDCNIGDITHGLVDCNLNATYNAVIEFINEYNKNK